MGFELAQFVVLVQFIELDLSNALEEEEHLVGCGRKGEGYFLDLSRREDLPGEPPVGEVARFRSQGEPEHGRIREWHKVKPVEHARELSARGLIQLDPPPWVRRVRAWEVPAQRVQDSVGLVVAYELYRVSDVKQSVDAHSESTCLEPASSLAPFAFKI